MSINRTYVDMAADLVRTALELPIPITLESLCDAIRNKLPGNCISKKSDELNVDAQIVTTGNSEFEIQYMEERPNTRISFSISHELGHLFLHLLEKNGTLRENKVCQRDLTQNTQELEANEFAAAFLMPEEEFIFKCDECTSNNKVNITKVADYFNVSVQAATVRGNVLKLW